MALGLLSARAVVVGSYKTPCLFELFSVQSALFPAGNLISVLIIFPGTTGKGRI
jgi:hypothetical protein